MSAENPQPQEGRRKLDFSKALETHRRIIASEAFLFGGDPRAVGRGGLEQVARRPDAERRLKDLSEPSYDDPDYAPGHGKGYMVHIDRATDDWKVTDRLGLHGP